MIIYKKFSSPFIEERLYLTTDVIKKVAPAVLTGDMILFNGEKIIKPTIDTISKMGSKIKSKLVKNSNIQ